MDQVELRKYLDIINENSEEVLTEGMLQKLAGLALGTVLALGPKIGQADTVYTYFDPGANKMQTVLDMSKVPASAKTVMAVDTDTQQVMLVRSGSPTAKEIKPDPVAVKQAQFTKDTKSFSDEPQKSKSQAEPNTPQVTQSNNFSIKGIKFGMTQKEIKNIASENDLSVPLLSSKTNMGINFKSILGISGEKFSTLKHWASGGSDSEIYRKVSYEGMPANLSFEDGKLVAISIGNDSSVISKLADQLIAKFGKPTKIDNQEWQNKAGAKFDNQILYWNNANGAAIKLAIRGDKINDGYVIIADPQHLDKMSNIEIQKNTANLKDF